MKIILTTHDFRDGPSQALLEYLNKKKRDSVVYIANKYLLEDDARTIKTVYADGLKINTLESHNFYYLPSFLIYIKDILYTFYYALTSKGVWDIYIGGDVSLTLPGILLKRLGKVKKLVFYTIDFSDNRFNNIFLNIIYILADKLGVMYADEVWNVSSVISSAREKHYLLNPLMKKKQKLVPLGAWVDRISKVSFDNCLKNTVVFMGHVIEKQGLQMVVKSIPDIVKFNKKFKLRIIGDGPYVPTLKTLASSLKVLEYIDFLGYIEDHKKVENLISECALALALYDPKIADFTYYADPGKVKNYLAAGVPVLITDVPKIAKDIEKNGAGSILEYNQKDIASTVSKLLNTPKTLALMRKRALNMGKEFDWNNIFKKVGL